ncbi:MAG: hypothetical protein MI747_02405 [Desulfobacterales bacterium]|nr:hypothetical protein [Desulfobacterales bacterium]
MTIEIHLTKTPAAEIRQEIEDLLRCIGQSEPECRRLEEKSESPTRGDAIAIAALILAIPGAVVATMDLVQRAKLSERIRALLKKLNEIDGGASLHVSGAEPLDLTNTSVDLVMDLMSRSRNP